MSQQAADFYSRFFQLYFMQNEMRADAAGFLAFWGKPGTGDTTVFTPANGIVDVDIQKSTGQELARMIHRGMGSSPTDTKIGESEDWTAFSMDYGLIEDEQKLTQKQLLNRLAGENPYSGATRQSRMHKLALKHHMKSLGKIFRTHAFLASQAILTGKHDQIIGTTNTDYQYDFRRDSNAIVTPANTWNGGSQDIMGDIDAGCEFLLANGYAMPDFMCLGQGMLDALIKDTTIQTLADNRRYELIQVSQNHPVPEKYARFVKAGFVPYGRFKTTTGYNLWMFTLPHNYKDLTGTVQKYMPTDKVLIASTEGRCDRYFGPRDSFDLTSTEVMWYQDMFGFNPKAAPLPMNMREKALDSTIYDPRSLHCDAYPMAGRKGVVMRTQSAPIYATTDTDVYYVIENGLT
jgi:hypothetical protein